MRHCSCCQRGCDFWVHLASHAGAQQACMRRGARANRCSHALLQEHHQRGWACPQALKLAVPALHQPQRSVRCSARRGGVGGVRLARHAAPLLRVQEHRAPSCKVQAQQAQRQHAAGFQLLRGVHALRQLPRWLAQHSHGCTRAAWHQRPVLPCQWLELLRIPQAVQRSVRQAAVGGSMGAAQQQHAVQSRVGAQHAAQRRAANQQCLGLGRRRSGRRRSRPQAKPQELIAAVSS